MNNIADDLSNAYSDGLRDGAPKWIKTADRLPEPWETVLLWDGDEMVSGYVDDDGDLIDHRWRLVFRATHWMLPEPPGGEGKDETY